MMLRLCGLLLLLLASGPARAEDVIIGLQGASTIKITAPLTRLKITGNQESEIQLTGDDLSHIEIERSKNQVHIIVRKKPLVELEVMVPATGSLVVEGQLADILIENVSANLNVRSRNNPIVINGVEGSVEARSYLAPVQADNINGDVRAESNQAGIRLEGINGDVWARTAGASISLRNSTSKNVELQVLNGTVKMDGEIPPDGKYRLASHTGVIDVNLSAASHATIELHGNPDNFSVAGLNSDPVSEREEQAVIGDGTGLLILESPRGPIRLAVDGE